MKLTDIFFEALQNEMPHFELQDGSIIDLNIEKYPVSDDIKRKLMMAFHQGNGVLAKTITGFIVFDQYGTHKATPIEQTQLKDVTLPSFWEKYSVKV